MKKVFSLLLLAALTSLPLAAQDLMDKLADEACNCISKKDVDNMSQEELQMQLGFCIMEAVGKYPDEFQKQYGDMNVADQSAMNKLGEQIGMKMAFKCPTILMKVADVQTQVQQQGAPMLESLIGTITAVSGDEVAVISLSDEQGRSHKLLWLDYFQGSDRLMNEGDKAIGKKVRVQYESAEYYSPKAKDYFGRKVVRALEFL